MQLAFDYHMDMDHHGNVTGGKGKLSCVRDMDLDANTIEDIINTPCRNIIKELQALFYNFYLHVPGGPTTSSCVQLSNQAKWEQDLQVKDA